MAPHRQMSAMLTTSEVAQLLSLHANTVRRWSNQGIIKAYRIGPRGDRRFRREDIAALLVKSETSRGNPSQPVLTRSSVY